jgi:methionyl-tRNA formyltransferase
MTSKGYDVLKAIIKSNYNNIEISVVVGRDKNVVDDYADSITDLCVANNVRHYERKSIGDLGNLVFDYAFAVGWRWLIISNVKLIVLHDSILPKYRGFAPLVNMLINGESKIGVTALFASEGYDAGDIITQKSNEIDYPIRINEAIEKVSLLYSEIVLELLSKIDNSESICGVSQNEKEASYSLWLSEDDYQIDWSKDASFIHRFINSVSYPYKGASTFINGNVKVRIMDSQLYDDVVIENRHFGKVIFIDDGCPVVVCGIGLLKVTEMFDEKTGLSMIPLKNFRTKFTS